MYFKIGSIKNFAIFTENTIVGENTCKENSFLKQRHRWLLLTVLPWQSKASWGACSLISRLPCVFDFDQKLSRNVAQVILYYHVTSQFLSWLSLLVTCFWFQNMFWKNIDCFPFWWKTYTKHCTSNDVISRTKRLSSPALCGWSGAFNFRVWFEKRNMAVKILILILFLFCLLSCLKNHSFWVLPLL